MSRLVLGTFIVATIAAAGCTMKDQQIPALTGPSEFGTSVTLKADPDALTQDGASRSQITATVRDANGKPLANFPLRAAITVNGAPADFGRLSANTVVTDSNGRATLVYTAPPAIPGQLCVESPVVIQLTPSSGDFANAIPRSVSIALLGQTPLPSCSGVGPNEAPVPAFTFSPSDPTENVKIFFDASGSEDPDGTIISYNWNFGDGDSGTGKTISRAYSAPGTYVVTLTVTDNRGKSASTSNSVTVGLGNGPTAVFEFSPTDPVVNQQVFFNASKSTGAPGHPITSYAWNFGDGTTATGITPPPHVFKTANTFKVTLTVTDDQGKTAAFSANVQVK